MTDIIKEFLKGLIEALRATWRDLKYSFEAIKRGY